MSGTSQLTNVMRQLSTISPSLALSLMKIAAVALNGLAVVCDSRQIGRLVLWVDLNVVFGRANVTSVLLDFFAIRTNVFVNLTQLAFVGANLIQVLPSRRQRCRCL